MECKFIIEKKENKTYTYYFEDDALIDIKIEAAEKSILQNIYVAKVKDVVKDIQSAFVEIQPNQRCYLSLPDCVAPIRCDYHNRNTKDTIVAGDEILVQVIKDAVKTKDPTVTTKLTISGKYVAISYPNNRIGYSNKLTANEKTIVKKCIASMEEHLFNPTYGYVLRTNIKELIDSDNARISPENASVLANEIAWITSQFHTLIETGKNKSIYSVLYESLPGYLIRIKTIPLDNTLRVITDDEETYHKITSYMKAEAPERLKGIQLYQDSALRMDKLYRLNTCLAEATARKVWLKGGGYLVIEPTEALTVIDVNSGKYKGNKRNSTSLQVNLEAAEEIARQIRIRNISGIIIVDFISMKAAEQNEQLLRQLRKSIKKDSVKTTVIDMTPLGLVEITRKKIEPPLWEQIR